MQVNRVTHTTMAATADRNIQAANQRLAAAQDRASSLKTINRPSDNPTDAAEAMSVRAQQRANVQFTRNSNDAQGWLATADSALTGTTNILQRTRELVMAGANDGSMSAQGREGIALEIDSLRQALLDTANTKYMGRSIFAATSDATAAFTAEGLYQGVGDSSVERRVGPHTTVRVDADGAQAFGSGEDSVFALLGSISADLRAGTPIAAHLDELGSWQSEVLAVQAAVGASHSTVLRAEESLRGDHVTLEARRSGLEDADLASVALELQTSELAYQVSLMATARVLQTSLMDYLR